MLPPVALVAEVAIEPPCANVTVLAATLIDPALPVPVLLAAICEPPPEIVRLEAATLTLPPAPEPAVPLAIWPPPVTATVPPATFTEPALPVEPARDDAAI